MVDSGEKALRRSTPARPRAGSSSPPGALSTAAATEASNARHVLDEVMDRYARGDDAAFDDLYRRAAPRLRGFLLRLCGDVVLADDLAQEAFLRIHRARGSFAAGAPALPWMLAVARNTLRDHARREQVRPRGARDADTDAASEGEGSPSGRGDEMLVAREMLEVVRVALDKLPSAQREAFVLVRFEGLSMSEAAEVLGVTEGAVKVRAFRAYEALRGALRLAETVAESLRDPKEKP